MKGDNTNKDINRLNSQEIVYAYQENIETQIDKTEVREDINEEWTNIKMTVVNSAKEIIGIWKKKEMIGLMMNAGK